MAETNAAKAAREAKQNDPTVEQESGDVIDQSTDIEPAGRTNTGVKLVTVKLAHPITRKDDLVYLGLDPSESYGVNDDVKVPVEAAKSLINAGMVQVDPEDRAAVGQTLGYEPTASGK